jgi:GGDEF domain-containing protein
MYNEFSQKPYSVSASFGWYLKSPQDSIALSEMVELADKRLYEAKHFRKLSLGLPTSGTGN